MSRELDRAVRQFADGTNSRIAEAASTRQIIATVASVTAGAASDGNALVTVSWMAGTYTVNGYGSTYTPVVGHRVVCDYIDGQLIVGDRIIGQP